ncbi:MAG: BlaI/MecI/CopY family transcriptional regulator, partial [Bacteroidales bacterium]|nr:BlaI/MecI/CopY family transcriptional regulator [Bacteroidales bacterium]
AYNTVSTIIRILESKGVVGHEPQGRGYIYFPLLSQDEYKSSSLKRLVSGYFSNSLSNMVSFFSKNQKMDLEEMEQIMKLMQQQIDEEKRKK